MAKSRRNQETAARSSSPVPEPTSTDPYKELGYTGLLVFGGQVQEELLRQLMGQTQQIRIYKEMSENDPIVGALLFAVEKTLRRVDWDVEAFSADNEDQVRAKALEGMMDDMSVTWTDFISECLSMLPFGWSYFETVYKARRGPEQADASLRSRYTDGLIGLRKLAIRSQDSLYKWEMDEAGGFRGMWQMVVSKPVTYIPIERALLFRTMSRKNSPQGKSILRNAFRPWWFKKRIEEIEAIGIERELNGIPIAYVPSNIIKATTSGDAATLEAIKKIVRTIKTDEQAGIVFPLVYDDKGNQLYKLELLSNNGRRAVDTSGVINRLDQRIAMTALADMILLGHTGVGARSMHDSKTALFTAALESILDSIADVLNRHLVPRLYQANHWPLDRPAKFRHGSIENVNLIELGDYIAKIAGAGAPLFPSADGELERHLLTVADLPTTEESEAMPAGGPPRRPRPKTAPATDPAVPADPTAPSSFAEAPADAGKGAR